VRADSATAHERRWWTLGVLCLSLTVISIDNTILNVALPSIVESLSARGSELQLLIDGYTIVFACLLNVTMNSCPARRFGYASWNPSFANRAAM